MASTAAAASSLRTRTPHAVAEGDLQLQGSAELQAPLTLHVDYLPKDAHGNVISAQPQQSKWFTIVPYPYEPPATRGDNGTCCGDCPGNAFGLIIAGVEAIVGLFQKR